jgi:hypothetical protein
MSERQAGQASAHFEEIVEATALWPPELVRRLDGKEVVVVSRDDFEACEPNLRDYLLTSGYAEEHDEFDEALRKVRKNGLGLFIPRAVDLEE